MKQPTGPEDPPAAPKDAWDRYIGVNIPPITGFEMAVSMRLRFTNGEGTCFVWADDRGAFLATAAHLLRGVAAGDVVEIRTNAGWQRYKVADFCFAADGIDVAVFCVEQFGYEHPAEMPIGGTLAIGQEVFFFGFPLGLVNEYPNENPFPTSLAKKATFSGVLNIRGVPVMVFDGFNNSGFSGGPIFSRYQTGMRLVGIVSGYHYDRSAPVLMKTADGGERETGAYVKPNSGFIYAHSAKDAIDAAAVMPSRMAHKVSPTREKSAGRVSGAKMA